MRIERFEIIKPFPPFCSPVNAPNNVLEDHHCTCHKMSYICEQKVCKPPCDRDLTEQEIDLEGWCQGDIEEPVCKKECYRYGWLNFG